MSFNQKCNMKIFCIELRNRIFNSVTVKYYVFFKQRRTYWYTTQRKKEKLTGENLKEIWTPYKSLQMNNFQFTALLRWGKHDVNTSYLNLNTHVHEYDSSVYQYHVGKILCDWSRKVLWPEAFSWLHERFVSC